MQQPPRYNRALFVRLYRQAMDTAGFRNDVEVANESGIHFTSVGRYRVAKRRIEFDYLVQIATAFARRMPDNGGTLIPALFEAAGYFPPQLPLAGIPWIVRTNRDDARVMDAWNATKDDPEAVNLWNSGVPLEPLLSILGVYLTWRDSQPGQQRLAGLSRLLTCGQVNNLS